MALSPYLIDRETYDGQQRMLVEMQHRDTPELVEPAWERRYPVTTAGAVQELHRRGLACSDERFVEMARRTGLPTRVIGRSYVWFAADSAAVAEDLAAMGVLLAVSIALAAGMIEFALPVAGLALVGALIATRPSLLRSISTLFYRLTGRAPRLWARVRTAAKTLHMFRGLRFFVPVAGLSVVGWLAEGYALYLILDWMGTPIDLWMAIAIFIFATLAGGLTGAPGGLGGAEAAMIALLTLQGVPLIVSVPATAVIRLTTLWFAIAIGAAVFPFAERAAARSLLGRPS